MAKSKSDLLAEAQKAGVLAEDVGVDDFTGEQLAALVSGEIPVHERKSSEVPLVAPDGHVVLSQADIDARDQ